MKKLMVYGLSVIFIAGSVASCKKSSKGKMDNEWKASSYNMTSNSTSGGGTSTQTTINSEDGASIKRTVVTTPLGMNPITVVTNGVIDDFSYVISKDGTWSSIYNITYTTTNAPVVTIEKIENTNSGTWDFLGGVGEFKKNERIVFNTLSKNEITTTTTTNNGTPVGSPIISGDVVTYADGEMSMIYTIVESKKKELQLTAKKDKMSVMSGSSDSETSLTLVSK